jgi:hypothetical protein
MRLPGHRPEAADLPEEPLQRVVAAVHVVRQEPAGFLGEVLQDRAGLEDRQRAARRILVDDRRDLVVGAQAQERRIELLAAQYVDVLEPVREPALLEHDCDLEPVRRRVEMQHDHGATL